MHLANRVRLVAFSAVLVVSSAAEPLRAGDNHRPEEATYTLPEIGLSEFLAEELGLPGVDDHNINLGGIGSDLWPGDDDNEYWLITDRGPNGEDPRTFPVPEFTPFILKVKAKKSGALEIKKAIPITGINDAITGITGLPNLDNTAAPPAPNEPFFACDGTTPLEPNPNGIDCEGLVRTRDGEFWVVEEYSPSLLHINRHGRVVRRFFPDELLPFLPPITGYDATDGVGIPALFGAKRKLNRGFEGLTASPNERKLYLALQSPLRNPDNATGDASRNTRILVFDTRHEKVVGEFVYRFQFVSADPLVTDEFDIPGVNNARPQDMKVSALAMVNSHRMLVLERTDFKAKVFVVDLHGATDIFGSVWDDVATAPSLEALNADGDLESHDIHPLSKKEVITLDSTVPVHGMPIPQKVEGLAILDKKTIAIANDNDFGVGDFAVDGGSCLLEDSGRESQLIVIRLDNPL